MSVFFFLFVFFSVVFLSTFDMDMHFKSALLIWMYVLCQHFCYGCPFYHSAFDMGALVMLLM